MENLLANAANTAKKVLALPEAKLKRECATRLRKQLHLFERYGYTLATAKEAVGLGFLTNVLPAERMDGTERMAWGLFYSPDSTLGSRKIAAYPICSAAQLPPPVIAPSLAQIALIEAHIEVHKWPQEMFDENGGSYGYEYSSIRRARVEGMECVLRILGIQVKGMSVIVEL